MTSTLLASIAGIIIGSATLALNEVASQAAVQGIIEEWSEWQWATFPLIGAALAAVSSMMFRNDRVRDTFGKFIASIVLGVSGPKIVTLIHPVLKQYSTDSILLILFGYLWGAVGFSLAKWFFDWLGRRGPQVADAEAEAWARRRTRQVNTEIAKEDEADRT